MLRLRSKPALAEQIFRQAFARTTNYPLRSTWRTPSEEPCIVCEVDPKDNCASHRRLTPHTGPIPACWDRSRASYTRDLKRWPRGLATHYAAALALIVVGATVLIVAAGVGISAGFYTLAIRYGVYVAYSIGEALFC
jgi:hypothetical protein